MSVRYPRFTASGSACSATGVLVTVGTMVGMAVGGSVRILVGVLGGALGGALATDGTTDGTTSIAAAGVADASLLPHAARTIAPRSASVIPSATRRRMQSS